MKDVKEIEALPELIEAKSAAAGVINSATLIKVTDKESSVRATAMLVKVCKAKKCYEAMRKQFTAPILASKKAIDDFFKARIEPVTNVEGYLRKQILDFSAAEDKRRADADAKAQKDHAAQQDTARNLGMAQTSAPLAAPAPEKTTHTASGSATTGKRWTFELIDIKHVPSHYLVINPPPINSAIKDGVREIPGLRIFEKPVLTVR